MLKEQELESLREKVQRFEASKEKLQQELDMYMEREKKIRGSHEKQACENSADSRNSAEIHVF